MTSKSIVGVIVAFVVIGGGYYFYSQSSMSSDEMMEGDEMSSGTDSQMEGKKMAFESFIKQGGSYVCTVHQNVEGTESEGTVYISGGNIRGEFNSTVQGMAMSTSLIVKDGYSYTWTSMMPSMGFKAPVDQGAGGDTSAGTSGSYSWNAQQIGDYNCEVWPADASKFALPSGVTFTEAGK